VSADAVALADPAFYRVAQSRPRQPLSSVSVVLSVIGHLALAGLLVALGRWAMARVDQPRAYMVNLVPDVGLGSGSPLETLTVEARDPSAGLTRIGEKEPPALSPAVVQPSPAQLAFTAPPAAAKPLQSTAELSGGATAGVTAVGRRSSIALDATDFPFTYYLLQLQRKVSERWGPAAGGAGYRAVVLFEIGRDGRIGAPRVEQSSGSTAYDLAAVRAVTEASLFPPRPLWLRSFSAPDRGAGATMSPSWPPRVL
jgi:TonB family protein